MRRPSGSAIAVIVGLVLLALPPIYILSSGPARWLVKKGYIEPGDSWLWAIYGPLDDIHEIPGMGPILDWYLWLWS